ncbi:MAG: alpha/beta hydrolase [Cyclobacteriaceae bacterium]|nr:alpha/beta hydrolase [Cyclobacteriaceae bacterium]
MKKLRYYILIPVVIAALYLTGPQPYPGEVSAEIPGIVYHGEELEYFVSDREATIMNLKLDNEARVIWYNDSLKNKTEYAVVYLHGFSASQGEGIPVHVDFGRRYGCNVYLSRLHGHGIHEKDALVDMTPENLVRSAAEALAIGKQVGERVILMGTSTGGTLSLYLASHHPDIHSLILFSPNIRINNPAAPLLAYPWGLQIGRMVNGGKYSTSVPESYEDSLYWTGSYRMEAAVYLQQLLNITMTRNTFRKITQPVFLAYYYKNEEEQDQTVQVDAMLEMFGQLGTSDSLKLENAFPGAGEHVIACKFKSDDWKGVRQATYHFAENILQMHPVDEWIPE